MPDASNTHEVIGLPPLTISVAGSELGSDALAALTALRVHQRLGAPAQCELTLAAAPPAVADRLAIGAALSVSLGAALFTGEVTALELAHRAHGTLDVRVRGYDVLHRLRKRQPVRAHLGLSAAALARELVGDLGVRVAAAADGPAWQHVLQWRQSDLELLVDVASRSGLHVTLHDGVLQLLSLEGAGAPVRLTWGETLLEADVELNAERACSGVRSSAWNVRDAVPLEGEASAPRVASSAAARPASPWPAERSLVDVAAEDARHVDGRAQAELDARASSGAVLRAVARGSAALRPGVRVAPAGLHALAAGEYAVTEAVHEVDPERGYLTRFTSEPPAPRALSGAAGASLAVVTRVDAGSGRVKVRLPTHASVETDWLQVAAPGAGKDKGLAFLPDVDDVVVLLMAHEDPSHAIVVGGVWGEPGPADSGVEGGNVRRFTLRSRGGHLVSLDDASGALRVEDAQGSFIDFSPRGVTLTAKAPLTLEAPGQPIVIRGDRVDFRKG